MPIETVRDRDLSTTIKVSGRFDFSCHRTFRDAYAQAPAQSDFVVDMAEATYVDSAALGMLLLLRDHAQRNGTRVLIANCNGSPKEVLEIANFRRLFKFL